MATCPIPALTELDCKQSLIFLLSYSTSWARRGASNKAASNENKGTFFSFHPNLKMCITLLALLAASSSEERRTTTHSWFKLDHSFEKPRTMRKFCLQLTRHIFILTKFIIYNYTHGKMGSIWSKLHYILSLIVYD